MKYLRRIVLWKRLTIVLIILATFLVLVGMKMHVALSEIKMVKTIEILSSTTPKFKTFNITFQHQKEEDYLMMEASLDNEERLKRIHDVCLKYSIGKYSEVSGNNTKFNIKYPPTPQFSVFFYDLEDNFAFCPLYKSASSTWLYNLCLLAGETEESLQHTKQQLSSIARKFFPELVDYEQAKEILESSTKLMVVRHPFERILSAYRDKLENINMGWEHGTGHFYRKYGAKIVRKYRPGGSKSVAVLKPGTYFWDKLKPKPAGIEPTFKEFVSYLLDTDLMNYADDHWIPYNMFCTPCLVNYDYVAKVETLSRDQVFIINKLGWKEKIKPKWRHKTKSNYISNEFITKAYFSQLSQQEVQLLYDKYKLDFEMFDYSPKLYYSHAKDY